MNKRMLAGIITGLVYGVAIFWAPYIRLYRSAVLLLWPWPPSDFLVD